MQLLRPLNILPHEVLSAHLEALRKMIYFLILGRSLELLGLAQPSPEDVPLAAVGWNYSNARGFHGVDHRVVNVRRVMHLETQRHILVHKPILVDHLDLLRVILLDFSAKIDRPQE